MKIKRVNALFPGLIRTTEAEEIRHNDSGSRRQEYRNHSAEKKSPSGFAMQTQKGFLGIRRADIKIVTAQPFIPPKVIKVAGGIRKIG